MKEQTARFEDQANELVNQLEAQYMFSLLLELQDAEHRAEGCGCPTCKKKPDTWKMMIQDEEYRLNPQGARVYEAKRA